MSTALARPTNPSRSRPPSHGSHRSERLRTLDVDEARRLVEETFLPHRLWISDVRGVDFTLCRGQFGRTAAGILSYGYAVQLHTVDATDFHVNVTLEGKGASSSGLSEPLLTLPGEAVIFAVGEPAHLTWSEGSRHLCFKAPRATVELELERLLGRSLPNPLQFGSALRAEVGQSWQPVLQLVHEELSHGSGVLALPGVADHVEALVIDGLLLSQPHNYSELVFRDSPPGSAGAIARAAELLEELPGEPWTVVGLARRVGLSVRALQYGFNRDFELPPMAYLRRVRLKLAHRRLQVAEPASTTVRAVALECGLTHLGRFAGAYRREFGESPSDTLAKRS